MFISDMLVVHPIYALLSEGCIAAAVVVFSIQAVPYVPKLCLSIVGDWARAIASTNQQTTVSSGLQRTSP